MATNRVSIPQLFRDFQGSDLYICPPCLFISVSVQLLMMSTAQWYSEFITDLASQRFGLGEFEMVSIAGRLLANKTGLRSDKKQMCFVPFSARSFRNQESAACCFSPYIFLQRSRFPGKSNAFAVAMGNYLIDQVKF